MHRALEIPEILSSIFRHCHPNTSNTLRDLSTLARTCRAFKEPALDELWAEIPDGSPLARCLPEASCPSGFGKSYEFVRSLTQDEWDILRGYTRRIRCIRRIPRGLDWESARIFMNPPITNPLFPLFPNIRHLSCSFVTEPIMRFLSNMPFPSLVSLCLDVRMTSSHALQDALESFLNLSTNIRRFTIHLQQPDIMFSDFFSSYICRWRDLQNVDCASVVMDMDALVHLSHMPTLTNLAFTLSATLPDQITPSSPPLFFSTLHSLDMLSEVLLSISQFLAWIRLPVITDLRTLVKKRPSKQALSSFLASVQTTNIGRTICGLSLIHLGSADADNPKPVLGLQDLEPCTLFNDIRRIDFNLEWDVQLTNDDLLALTSSWPHLEKLLINEDWGWNTPGGITPDGVRRLLETCQSLQSFSLAIDTRGCAAEAASRASSADGWTRRLPPGGCIDVLDSNLEADAVPAMAAFLASIASRANFLFRAGRGWFMDDTISAARWRTAYGRANIMGIVG